MIAEIIELHGRLNGTLEDKSQHFIRKTFELMLSDIGIDDRLDELSRDSVRAIRMLLTSL